MVKGDYKSKTKVTLVTKAQLRKAGVQLVQTSREKYGEAKRYFGKTKIRRLPSAFKRASNTFNSQPNVNMFQKGIQPTPIESSMDLLFGSEGENLIGNTQAIFPQMHSSDVGDVISSVQAEMFGQPQPQRFVQRRRRR
jgi:hypothetical protein